jgi:porin
MVLLLGFSASLASSVEFTGEYTGDIFSNTSGGLQQGTRYLDNLDLVLTADFGGKPGTNSGTFHVHALYNNGGTFSEDLVGDLQVVSNIDAGEAWRIFEFWYEFGSDDWSVKSGLYDLNSEFDVNETGSIFLNSSHGIGAELSQTGENGPSIFPVSSLSVRAAYQAESFALRAAVLDAVPGDPDDAASNAIRLDSNDGYLAIAEVDIPVKASGRLWAGYWRYSAKLEQPFAPGPYLHNAGWYVGGEKRFSIGSRSAAGFIRYGQANERLNALRDYTGLGVRIDGMFASRPDDQFGIAVASARAGDPYRYDASDRGIHLERRETTWELTYRMPFNEHLVLQPDIQFVQNPSMAAHLDNAWIVGLRVVICN